MEQKLAFKISIIGLILLLLGVGIYLWRKPVTCSKIEEQALRSLDFNRTDVDEMLHWLETTHQALIRPVQKYETIAGETELKWQGLSGIY